MAGAAYAHADGFGYSGKLQVGWRFPFARVEGEAVFGEKQAGFLLLDGAVVGDHGWFGAGGLGLSLRLGCGWRTVAIEKKEKISSLDLLLVVSRQYNSRESQERGIAYAGVGVVDDASADSDSGATTRDWRLELERARKTVLMRLIYLEKPSGLSSPGRAGVSCGDMIEGGG